MAEHILENKIKKKVKEASDKAKQALKDRAKQAIEDAPGAIANAGVDAIKKKLLKSFLGLRRKR
jgi:hypothetical protein